MRHWPPSSSRAASVLARLFRASRSHASAWQFHRHKTRRIEHICLGADAELGAVATDPVARDAMEHGAALQRPAGAGEAVFRSLPGERVGEHHGQGRDRKTPEHCNLHQLPVINSARMSGPCAKVWARGGRPRACGMRPECGMGRGRRLGLAHKFERTQVHRSPRWARRWPGFAGLRWVNEWESAERERSHTVVAILAVEGILARFGWPGQELDIGCRAGCCILAAWERTDAAGYPRSDGICWRVA